MWPKLAKLLVSCAVLAFCLASCPCNRQSSNQFMGEVCECVWGTRTWPTAQLTTTCGECNCPAARRSYPALPYSALPYSNPNSNSYSYHPFLPHLITPAQGCSTGEIPFIGF